jgi:hypothetical protein|tara:strand:+ start:139 stop:447 length:309 start_codon:yes stop_codon:yes gene_type:complete
MLFMFPVVLFGIAVYDSFAQLACVSIKLLHFPLLAVCIFLLILDRCGKRDPTYYWAYMFIVWSWLFAFFCLSCLTVVQLEIGCWSFAAGAWQVIRLIALNFW